MTTHRHARRLAAIATVAIAGCGGTAATTTSPATAAAALTGSLRVLAAASLAAAFDAAETTLTAHNPGFSATDTYAGSQQLVQNVLDGAAADVIATADSTTMQRLVTAGLVETPKVFARNRLEIAVAPGNPKGIHGLADLAGSGVVVVLADPTVPAGKYAVQALAKAGVSVTPKSLELSVSAVLQKVEAGDADAAIVYVTDVIGAGGKADGVVIPDSANVIAQYPIAVLKATANALSAERFVTAAVSGVIQSELLRRGFLAP